jgi:hypothetical protein
VKPRLTKGGGVRYVRRGQEGSMVHVYRDARTHGFVCASCILSRKRMSIGAKTAEKMLGHLERHLVRRKGSVPWFVFDALRADASMSPMSSGRKTHESTRLKTQGTVW